MKKIQLTCFATQDADCVISSAAQSFQITNPLDKELILSIANQGNGDCSLKLQVNRSSQVEQASKLTGVSVSSLERIYFKGNFSDFVQTTVDLGSIKAQSSLDYFIFLDLLDLVLEEGRWTLNFDLLLNFHCEAAQLVAKPSVSINQAHEALVLSASDSAKEQLPTMTNIFHSPAVYVLLSSLFVLVFFVIMKLVHEQKKKKQVQNAL